MQWKEETQKKMSFLIGDQLELGNIIKYNG